LRIGSAEFAGIVGLAPMAGMTDAPMRARALAAGAGWAVTEMIGANPRLHKTQKTENRLRFHRSEVTRVVQIAGADPAWCADAARRAQAAGAHVVDINMGCPAKKVCNKAAGSALMRDEPLVARILEAVVAAVDVPVTLKTRAGWDRDHLNAPVIARIAEAAGVAAIAIHGRTRACRFAGTPDYDVIGEVVAAVSVPVLANGDLDSADKVRRVLAYTGAAGCLVGRAAMGNPWLFSEIGAALGQPGVPPVPSRRARWRQVAAHVADIHAFYGPGRGFRIARKHAAAYFETLGVDADAARAFMAIDSDAGQLDTIDQLAARDASTMDAAPAFERAA